MALSVFPISDLRSRWVPVGRSLWVGSVALSESVGFRCWLVAVGSVTFWSLWIGCSGSVAVDRSLFGRYGSVAVARSLFGHDGLVAVGQSLCFCCYKSVAVLYGLWYSEGKRSDEKNLQESDRCNRRCQIVDSPVLLLHPARLEVVA